MSRLRFPLVTDRLTLTPEDEKNIWTSGWDVRLKEKGKDAGTIGSFRFIGAKEDGEIGISVELLPEYRDQGYGSEIFFFMAEFVFRFRNMREITASCPHENNRCIRALDKAGYVYRENRRGTDYYSKKRPKTAWTGLYVVVGVSAGFLLGIVVSNLLMGTAIGVIVGVIVGFLLDKKRL